MSEAYRKREKQIKDAFIDIYASKNFSQIRVQDICKATGIVRTTFYNYYQDIYELLEAIETEYINDLKQINKPFAYQDFKVYKEKQEFDFFRQTLDYIEKQAKGIRVLMDKDSQFMYKWRKIIREDFSEKYRIENVSEKNYALVLEMIVSGVLGVYHYWLHHMEKIEKTEVEKEVLYRLCMDFIDR